MKKIITLIIILGVLIVHSRANAPICEIYNEGTNQCELLADQNFTINLKWIKIVGDHK